MGLCFCGVLCSIERFIFCTHCLNRQSISLCAEGSSPTPTLFRFVDVVKAMDNASDPAVRCQGTDVKIALLAPDLALLDLPVLKNVHTDKILGKGGFGQVWRGRWHDREVAVKELITAVSIDEQDRVANFLSFQKVKANAHAYIPLRVYETHADEANVQTNAVI